MPLILKYENQCTVPTLLSIPNYNISEIVLRVHNQHIEMN